jgi:hypothetical protein
MVGPRIMGHILLIAPGFYKGQILVVTVNH